VSGEADRTLQADPFDGCMTIVAGTPEGRFVHRTVTRDAGNTLGRRGQCASIMAALAGDARVTIGQARSRMRSRLQRGRLPAALGVTIEAGRAEFAVVHILVTVRAEREFQATVNYVRQGAAGLGWNVTIGPGVRIGDDCVVHANVSIRERVSIGHRVVLQDGVVLGGDGYGFVRRGDGTHEKIPQVAGVVVEDDVEIGANTTVDRPAVGETRIRAGAKIDNLVQIAHGVTIGRNALMAAQVGISGSTTIGDDVIFGGQVGVGGHLTIGKGAIAVGQSGVTNSLDPGARVAGYPAIDNQTWRRASVLFKHLPQLKKRIDALEAEIANLKKKDPT